MASQKLHGRSPSAATTGTNDGDSPQSMVITSLRNQVSDLVSQVTQLNSKLVQSYDRISDLEDNLHISSSTLRNSTLKISQLELERTQHLSALNTGLLVEKSHVTSELTRLMEKATDEAARRGMAESARQEIEKDLDDLSAELFDRANNMVADARLSQAKSERRAQDAEAVLKGAEEAVTSMQAQMQALQEEKDRTDRETNEMRILMGKGKWVEREQESPRVSLKLLSTHAPYQEFLLFVAHLRQIRPVTPQMPPMATLLPLPFLTRLVSEDSDPTLRLDTAPSLNWLTRRSVVSAIHQSQLTIEPVSVHALLELCAPSASQQSPSSPPCALCGKPVLPSSQTPSTPSWRPTFFSKQNVTPAKSVPLVIHSPTPSVATSASFYPPSASSRLSPPLTPPLPSPPVPPLVYIFRLQTTSQSGTATAGTVYPLCTSGWCLARLRATCELWRFVRNAVVEKVWEEEVPDATLVSQRASSNGVAKPPVPPRRRTMNVGKLIGMASSALGMEKNTSAKGGSGSGSVTPTKQEERLSPPPTRRATGAKFPNLNGIPPPLPRRSDVRAVSKAEDEKKADEVALIEAKDVKNEAPKGEANLEASLDKDSKPTDLEQNRSPSDVKQLKTENTSVSSSKPELPTLAPTAPDVSADLADEFVTPQGTPAHSPTSPTAAHTPRARNSLDELTMCAQIPLPESPVVATFAASEALQPEGNEKLTITSPVEETSHSDVTATDVTAEALPAEGAAAIPTLPVSAVSPVASPPSRTASPAPPPLPKRAARRAVPAPPTVTPKPTAEPPLPADPPSTPAPSSTEEPAKVNGIEPNVTQPQETAPDAVPSLPSAESLALPPPETQPSEDSAPVTETSARDLPPPPTHPASKPRDPSPRAPSNPSGPPAEDHEPYVGDATWEERTWKELVRLREDMFYARIGTMR